jgi:hypothetical protein
MKKQSLPKSLKGKYVTRSAFAKMQGEKQRLEKDIYTLVMGDMVDAIFLKKKYRDRFEKEKEFWDEIKKLLKSKPSPNAK